MITTLLVLEMLGLSEGMGENAVSMKPQSEFQSEFLLDICLFPRFLIELKF